MLNLSHHLRRAWDSIGDRLWEDGDGSIRAMILAILLGAAAIPLIQCVPSPTHRPAAHVEKGPEIVYAPVRREELMPTGRGSDGGVPRLGIPPGPSPMLKAPPCNREAEEYTIEGNCWQATPRKPPCGEWLREHDGTCYRALPSVPPVSGQ